MNSLRMILVRLTAAVAALFSLTNPSAALAEPAVEAQRESYVEAAEEVDFAEETVPEEKVAEAEVQGMGCALARFIFSQDGQELLRIEYYDVDGNLAFCSQILDFDAASRSYTEEIYAVDPDSGTRTLLWTNTYAGGVLAGQEFHSEMPEGAEGRVASLWETLETSAPSPAPASRAVSARSESEEPAETTQPGKVPAATESEKVPAVTEPVKTPAVTEPVKAPTEPAPAASAEPEPAAAPTAPAKPEIVYDRTTSIYTDDEKTLLRVEYYDSNNKLTHYSSVEGYDNETKSYTENIYRYDWDTQTEILERTDVYVNGELQDDAP